MNTSVETPAVGVPMDPRIRQRRIEVQREAGRRRLRLLLAGAAVAALAALGYAATRSPLLDVDTVKVRGLTRTDADHVMTAAGLGHRPQMIDVEADVVAARVEQLPWIARVEVQRDWPGTVEITVVERTPLALVVAPSGEHFAYLDRSGRVLGPAPSRVEGLAVVGGVAEVPAAGEAIDGADAALALLAALGGEPPVVEVREDGGLHAVLGSGTLVTLGDASELSDKVMALRTLAHRMDLAAVATIDLRVPSAPALTRR